MLDFLKNKKVSILVLDFNGKITFIKGIEISFQIFLVKEKCTSIKMDL
jgi:hypothetical protein